MTVSNEIWIIGVAYLVNLLVIYKKTRILGGIIFMGLSIATMAYSTSNQIAAVGLMLLLGSIGVIIHDLFKKPEK
jgi:hypothetical protein